MDKIGKMFYSTKIFDSQWDDMGLFDEDRRMLENEIANNPSIGTVIRGTGGLRKMRFALGGRGKSGGARVLYVDFIVYERIYLVYAYPKNEKQDITIEEREAFRRMIEKAKSDLGEQKHE